MVARPPVRIVIDRMKVEDLPAVHVIERESFSTPWPAHAYRQELENNRLAAYIVARWERGDRRLRRHMAARGRGPCDHVRDAAGLAPARE